jgi:hypothetical protein
LNRILNNTKIPHAWKNPIGFKKVVAGTNVRFHRSCTGHARNTPKMNATNKTIANPAARLLILSIFV